MLPELEKLKEAEPKFEVLEQELGGRVAGTGMLTKHFTKKRKPKVKGAVGIMRYTDVTNTNLKEVTEAKKVLKQKLKQARSLKELQ